MKGEKERERERKGGDGVEVKGEPFERAKRPPSGTVIRSREGRDWGLLCYFLVLFVFCLCFRVWCVVREVEEEEGKFGVDRNGGESGKSSLFSLLCWLVLMDGR